MMLEEKTYPPLNMHFKVQFDNKKFKLDYRFQSVQGLKVRICKNESGKGTHTKYENIILKRAYQPDSKLIEWCMNAINHHKKQPQNLTVKLLNAKNKLLSAWKIEQAVPVGWGVEELHAQDTKILIECIELEYKHFQVVDGKENVIAPIDS